MPDERGTVRRIDWRELCPWLLILKAFRPAAGARVLTLALLGLLTSAAGVKLVNWVFSSSEDSRVTEMRRDSANWPILSGFPAPPRLPDNIDQLLPGRLTNHPVEQVWQLIATPFVRLFARDNTLVSMAYLILVCGWTLAVWAFFGGAITRIAAVTFAREDRLGFFASLGFARRKWFSFLAGPLFPFVGVLLAVIPLFFLGLLFRAAFFYLLSILFWPLALAAAFFLALVTLGLLYGWPLMWGTISTEGTDAFDALSRSYNYLRERPLHYLWYLVVAAFFGCISALVVMTFADVVVYLADWAVLWGMGNAAHAELENVTNDTGWFVNFGHNVIGFYNGCVYAMAGAFLLGFFWCAMTAVYMLMRLKVDATELDEIYLPDEDQAYGLPPLALDESGVPQVADAPPELRTEPKPGDRS